MATADPVASHATYSTKCRHDSLWQRAVGLHLRVFGGKPHLGTKPQDENQQWRTTKVSVLDPHGHSAVRCDAAWRPGCGAHDAAYGSVGQRPGFSLHWVRLA
jgi:hypothetical protein